MKSGDKHRHFNISEHLNELRDSYKRRKVNRVICSFLAVIVAAATVNEMVLPAISVSRKESVLDCHFPVHEHTEECYETLYDEEGNEIGKELICGQADYVVHQHTDECYRTVFNAETQTEEKELVCTLPEIEKHEHDESCYEERQVLVCEEDHEHDESCYETEKVLICDKLELHTHTDDCYEIIYDEAGKPVDKKLICGKIELLEHQHDESCFTEVEVAVDEEAETAAEESEPTAEEEIIPEETAAEAISAEEKKEELNSSAVSAAKSIRRDATGLLTAEEDGIQVTIVKSWLNKDGTSEWPLGEEVEMTLCRMEGETAVPVEDVINPVVLREEEQSYTWSGLPEADEEGTEIIYGVKESGTIAGYSSYAITENGSDQTDIAPVIDGTAAFVNRENEGGKVNIQITKYVQDSDGNIISLLTDTASVFTVYHSNTDTPDSVIDVNKGSYSTAYDTDSYTDLIGSVLVRVGSEGQAYDYANDLDAGMYTIIEDPSSIPDEIIDTDGRIWRYRQTVIRTEYAWRQNGDEGQQHYSDLYTKENGSYIAVPEVAGAYTGPDGSNLYNGFLEFFVSNIYEDTEETAETQTMDINLHKQWSPSIPESGSVTFLLHQVRKTTVTDGTGPAPGPEASVAIIDPWGSSAGRMITAYDDGSLIRVGDRVRITTSGWMGNLDAYAVSQGLSDIVLLGGTGVEFTVDASSAILSISCTAGDLSIVNADGSGGSGSITVETDPADSGYPRTLVLTGPDWNMEMEGLLAGTEHGNTTTEYSYYLEETGLTGQASAYTSLSFAGMGSQSNPISGTGEVDVYATNTVPNPNDKFLTVHKTWIDQDDEPLLNHPDEVKVDVYRVKLPTGAGGEGEISFNSSGDVYSVIGNPETWQDNNNYVPSQVIFDNERMYFYIRSNNQAYMSREQLIEFARRIMAGEKVQGDWVTSIRPSPVYTPEQLYNNGHGLDIPRGSLCYYNNEYYVLLDTGANYGEIMHSNGGPGKEGQWEKVANGLIITDLDINPPENKLLVDEESIINEYLPELYRSIDAQLIEKETGITWSDEDKELKRYMINDVPVTLTITELDNWSTSFTAESGYLYFFFEQPLPGYTTRYRNEEHGVFGQTQEIEVVNQTAIGQLDVTKEWTGENVAADIVYAKILRDNVDITDDIASNAAAYGLTSEQFIWQRGHRYLMIPRNGDSWETVSIKDLPIAEYTDDAAAYQYAVQEVGYHDNGTDHWSVSDVLEGYESTEGSNVPAVNTGTISTPVTVGSVNTDDEGNITLSGYTSTVLISNGTPDDTGSLKITKAVQLNGIATEDARLNGTYTFTVTGTGDSSTIAKTVTLTVENGRVIKAEGDGVLGTDLYAEIAGLPPGDYIVREIESSNMDVLPDAAEHIVTVTAGKSGNNVPDSGKLTVVNNLPYVEAEITGIKELKGDTLTEGQFAFDLTAVTEDAPMPEVTHVINEADGTFAFGRIAFTASDLGTETVKVFEYTVREDDSEAIDGICYDTKPKTVTITVTNTDGVLSAAVSPDGESLKFINEKLKSFTFTKLWKNMMQEPDHRWKQDIVITLSSQKGTIGIFTLTAAGGTDQTYTWTGKTDGDGFRFTVNGLPAYVGDEELVYYVTEQQVSGYTEPKYGFMQDESIIIKPETDPSKDRALDGQYIVNAPEDGAELPHTGGTGTYPYTIPGMIILLTGIVLFLLQKKTVE